MSYRTLLKRSRNENVLNSVLLELTYSCNLDCTFCYNDLNLRGRRISLERYRSLLDELADMGVVALILSGGEPLVYNHFFDLGAYAREKGFLIKVKSNGIPLNRRNARRLRSEVDPYLVEISLHGARPESHDRLTQVPGSFDRLLKNIRILLDEGIRLRVNATLTRWNEGEVDKMFALADRLGVLLRFNPEVTPKDDGDTSPLAIAPSSEGIANMLLLSMERNSRWRDPDELPLSLKPGRGPEPARDGEKPKVCGAGSTNLIVDPFGNVYPCVQFRRKAGNIHEQSIRQIWDGSEQLKEVRTLAERAYGIATGEGLKPFCMGVNELRTGDPLITPDSKIEMNRVLDRVSWEVRNSRKEVA